MATIEDAGAARPTQIRLRIVEGRPFVSDFPYRLKSGLPWPTAPVLHFNGPSGVITWTSTLSDGGKLATVTATKAEVDTLLGHSSRGIAQLDDPSTGRLWAAGDYFEVGTAWAGGANPVALADGAVVVDDRLVIMGGEGGTGGPVSWAEVTGKPSSYPPSPHSHTATDLSGVVKTVNGTAPDGSGNVTVATGSGTPPDATSFVVDDTPAKPAEGAAVTYWVTSAVTWPAGLVWSDEPDGGVAPTITSRALVSMVTTGGTTYAVAGSTFTVPAAPDTTAPAWSATLTTGTPAATSVVVAASALATDAVGVTQYQFTFAAGDSGWAAIVPSGLNFTITGLTASTAYAAPRFRARDAAGNWSPILTAQAFTTAAGASALADAIMALSPVGYWKLDETSGTTATDSSGNARHGVYAGALTLAGQDGFVKFGGAGWVHVGDFADFSVNSSGAGLSVFMLLRGDGTPGNQGLVSVAANPHYEWACRISDNSVRFNHTVFPSIIDMGENSLAAGVWKAAVASMSHNATNGKTYVNDGTATVSTGSGTPTSTSAPLVIGQRGGSSGDWPTMAAMGHVAVFATQLSDAQVSALMTAAAADGYIS